jgi:hypothetical protein
MSERSMQPFTEFETDPDLPGVHWDAFVTAVGVWTGMQAQPPSVAAAMLAFNTTADKVRAAVREHPWLFCNWVRGETDPDKWWIEIDGE